MKMPKRFYDPYYLIPTVLLDIV